MAEIIPPERGSKLDTVEGRIAAFFESVARLSIIEGEGSPEGSEDAPKLRYYFDNTNLKLYLKTTDLGTKTGWVALN